MAKKNRQSYGLDALIGPKKSNDVQDSEETAMSTKMKTIETEAENLDVVPSKQKAEKAHQTTVQIPISKHKRLSILSINIEKTHKELINEAIDLLLEKYQDEI